MLNTISKHSLALIAAIVLLVAVDRCSTSATEMSNMSETAYNVIRAKFTWYTDADIAHEYNSNKEYWDGIIEAFNNGEEPIIE